MGGRPGDGTGATGRPWASLFDPVANARALADIQAQALRAAGEVVERLARLSDGSETRSPADGNAGTASDGDTPPARDAANLLEAWIELLQRASKSFTGASSGERGSNARDDERVEVDLDTDSTTALVRLEVDGSGAVRVGTAEVWLHNGTAESVGPLTFLSGELRSPDGDPLAATLACDPAQIDVMPARSSRGVALTVAKEGALRPGTYRGLIQVQGAPQVWLTVEVVVGDAGAAS
jgi:hypothetical protein